jgi:hypothetical protein
MYKTCGDDGCGGSCGDCPPDMYCDGYNCQPYCQPNCWNKQCGDDGCGGSCGYCPYGYTCNAWGQCQPGGSKTCIEIVDCVMGCYPLTQQCVNQCMSGASQSSQQLFIQLAQCATQVCGLPPSTDCMYQAFMTTCAKQYESCKMDYPTPVPM